MSCANPILMLQVEITESNKWIDIYTASESSVAMTEGFYDSMVDVAAELDMKVSAVYMAKSRVLRRLRQDFRGLID